MRNVRRSITIEKRGKQQGYTITRISCAMREANDKTPHVQNNGHVMSQRSRAITKQNINSKGLPA
jgi:hypothetical protein